MATTKRASRQRTSPRHPFRANIIIVLEDAIERMDDVAIRTTMCIVDGHLFTDHHDLPPLIDELKRCEKKTAYNSSIRSTIRKLQTLRRQMIA